MGSRKENGAKLYQLEDSKDGDQGGSLALNKKRVDGVGRKVRERRRRVG
jgi:hypothetical protein